MKGIVDLVQLEEEIDLKLMLINVNNIILFS